MYVECGSNRCTIIANLLLALASSSSFAIVFLTMRGPAMSWFDSGMSERAGVVPLVGALVMLVFIQLPSMLSTSPHVSGYLLAIAEVEVRALADRA